MKQFFKFLFASCLGVFLAFGIVFLILMAVGMSSSGDKKVSVKPNTVLELNFDSPIPELTNNVERDPFELEQKDVVGLEGWLNAIDYAKTDNNIKGILIKPEMQGGIGIAGITAIRDALLDFKDSGKFVIGYSTWYNQAGYYLSSVADEVYIHPMGTIDFRGYAATIPFFKDGLDKLGVKMNAYYAGQFKSATEPYRRNDMSEQAKAQLKEYLDDIYDVFLDDISDSRGVGTEQLNNISENMLINNAEDAVSYKLVDKIGYRDEVIKDVRNRLALEEKDKLKTIGMNDYYAAAKNEKDYSVKDKIAVIYAEGNIVDENDAEGIIAANKYTKIIRKIAKDEKVKAIVLRVNSPGGSGLASENIWRELMLAKEKGKKIVVSMGDYAASGGYYISCAADSILAEENTLTGSIGVFSLIPNTQELMNDKLGIHVDTVGTGRFSGAFNPALGVSEGEAKFFQGFVDEMYDRFLERVATARGMSKEAVHEIAQGRIWSGTDAVENGLVDKIGNMDDALTIAANLAGIEKYRISAYPKPKDPIQKIIDKISGKKEDAVKSLVKAELGEWAPYYELLEETKGMQGAQTRLPFKIEFE